MKTVALAILVLLSTGCSERSLTRQQLSGITQLDVVVVAVQAVPFAREPATYQPPKRPPLDTSKGAGATLSQMFSNAAADTSASMDDQRHRQTLASAGVAILQEMRSSDFAGELVTETRQSLSKVTAVRTDVRSPPLTSRAPFLQRAAYERSMASAVLVFVVEYSMVEAYGVDYFVAFNATAMIFAKTDELKKLRRRANDSDPLAEDNAIYRRDFDYDVKYRPGTVPAMSREAARSLAARLATGLERAN